MKRFLRILLRPLLKTGLPLIGNVLKTLAKSVVIPLRVRRQHQRQTQLFKRKCSDLVLQN